ncbi:transposase, partial [Collinsella tanakaei]|uniref:transposase n=1 Tax=Collinsella tanakaei TaxID=626935 RepID=UPI0026EDBDE3
MNLRLALTDATWVKCRVEGRSVSQAIVTAIALGEDGCKHFCGADVMDTESYADW